MPKHTIKKPLTVYCEKEVFDYVRFMTEKTGCKMSTLINYLIKENMKVLAQLAKERGDMAAASAILQQAIESSKSIRK